MNVDLEVTKPSLSASICLYHSYDVNRIAILGTIPVRTAPRPLYRPSAVSRFTISVPVLMNPRFGAYNQVRIFVACYGAHSRLVGGHTPGMRARLESCMRTLIVSVKLISYTLSGKVDFRRKPYPEDDTRVPPSYQLHLQLKKN